MKTLLKAGHRVASTMVAASALVRVVMAVIFVVSLVSSGVVGITIGWAEAVAAALLWLVIFLVWALLDYQQDLDRFEREGPHLVFRKPNVRSQAVVIGKVRDAYGDHEIVRSGLFVIATMVNDPPANQRGTATDVWVEVAARKLDGTFIRDPCDARWLETEQVKRGTYAPTSSADGAERTMKPNGKPHSLDTVGKLNKDD